MNDLKRQSLPRWYGLSWSAADPAILIRIQQSFLARLEPMNKDAPIVGGYVNMFAPLSFCGDFARGFGFDNSLIRKEDNGGYAIFHAQLPKVRLQTAKRCLMCGGRKKDRVVRGEPCYSCEGTGKEHEYRWREAQLLSTSLALLFQLIEFSDTLLLVRERQLLTVLLGALAGASPICGTYGIEFVGWLRGQYRRPLDEMVEPMRTAYSHMMGKSRAHPDRFSARVDHPSGWLNVGVEGDRCGLYATHEPQPGQGYDFSDHNTDNPAQQLAMVAGLAALHDRVDRELRPQS